MMSRAPLSPIICIIVYTNIITYIIICIIAYNNIITCIIDYIIINSQLTSSSLLIITQLKEASHYL